jgi:hypothetical protein
MIVSVSVPVSSYNLVDLLTFLFYDTSQASGHYSHVVLGMSLAQISARRTAIMTGFSWFFSVSPDICWDRALN